MAVQRSLEWFRERLGSITGSKLGVLMKSGKGKEKPFSETGLSYIRQLAAERTMNHKLVNDDMFFQMYLDQTDITTKRMAWGTDNEENARLLYTLKTGIKVSDTGSVRYKRMKWFSASPDGIIKDVSGNTVGCVEIKCPSQETFVKYVRTVWNARTLLNSNPDYYWQCMAEMMCTNTKWCDFVVYNPFQENPIYIVRINFNDNAAKSILDKVTLANKEIRKTVTALKKKRK